MSGKPLALIVLGFPATVIVLVLKIYTWITITPISLLFKLFEPFIFLTRFDTEMAFYAKFGLLRGALGMLFSILVGAYVTMPIILFYTLRNDFGLSGWIISIFMWGMILGIVFFNVKFIVEKHKKLLSSFMIAVNFIFDLISLLATLFIFATLIKISKLMRALKSPTIATRWYFGLSLSLVLEAILEFLSLLGIVIIYVTRTRIDQLKQNRNDSEPFHNFAVVYVAAGTALMDMYILIMFSILISPWLLLIGFGSAQRIYAWLINESLLIKIFSPVYLLIATIIVFSSILINITNIDLIRNTFKEIKDAVRSSFYTETENNETYVQKVAETLEVSEGLVELALVKLILIAYIPSPILFRHALYIYPLQSGKKDTNITFTGSLKNLFTTSNKSEIDDAFQVVGCKPFTLLLDIINSCILLLMIIICPITFSQTIYYLLTNEELRFMSMKDFRQHYYSRIFTMIFKGWFEMIGIILLVPISLLFCLIDRENPKIVAEILNGNQSKECGNLCFVDRLFVSLHLCSLQLLTMIVFICVAPVLSFLSPSLFSALNRTRLSKWIALKSPFEKGDKGPSFLLVNLLISLVFPTLLLRYYLIMAKIFPSKSKYFENLIIKTFQKVKTFDGDQYYDWIIGGGIWMLINKAKGARFASRVSKYQKLLRMKSENNLPVLSNKESIEELLQLCDLEVKEAEKLFKDIKSLLVGNIMKLFALTLLWRVKEFAIYLNKNVIKNYNGSILSLYFKIYFICYKMLLKDFVYAPASLLLLMNKDLYKEYQEKRLKILEDRPICYDHVLSISNQLGEFTKTYRSKAFSSISNMVFSIFILIVPLRRLRVRYLILLQNKIGMKRTFIELIKLTTRTYLTIGLAIVSCLFNWFRVPSLIIYLLRDGLSKEFDIDDWDRRLLVIESKQEDKIEDGSDSTFISYKLDTGKESDLAERILKCIKIDIKSLMLITFIMTMPIRWISVLRIIDICCLKVFTKVKNPIPTCFDNDYAKEIYKTKIVHLYNETKKDYGSILAIIIILGSYYQIHEAWRRVKYLVQSELKRTFSYRLYLKIKYGNIFTHKAKHEIDKDNVLLKRIGFKSHIKLGSYLTVSDKMRLCTVNKATRIYYMHSSPLWIDYFENTMMMNPRRISKINEIPYLCIKHYRRELNRLYHNERDFELGIRTILKEEAIATILNYPILISSPYILIDRALTIVGVKLLKMKTEAQRIKHYFYLIRNARSLNQRDQIQRTLHQPLSGSIWCVRMRSAIILMEFNESELTSRIRGYCYLEGFLSKILIAFWTLLYNIRWIFIYPVNEETIIYDYNLSLDRLPVMIEDLTKTSIGMIFYCGIWWGIYRYVTFLIIQYQFSLIGAILGPLGIHCLIVMSFFWIEVRADVLKGEVLYIYWGMLVSTLVFHFLFGLYRFGIMIRRAVWKSTLDN